jgi:hypothetical protein
MRDGERDMKKRNVKGERKERNNRKRKEIKMSVRMTLRKKYGKVYK